MEIVFNTKTVPYCREVFRQAKVVSEHADCVVSDSKEDIGKIAWAEAQLCLQGKEIGIHGVSVELCAEVFVYYLTEDRGSLACMRLKKETVIEFECGELDRQSELQIRLSCQGVQARAVNPRKIAADLAIRAELTAYVRDNMVCSLAEEAEQSLHLLREQRTCQTRYQVCEKSFVVSEQLPLERGGIREILSSHVELMAPDSQMIGGKVLIKGGAELRFGLESEEGPSFLEQCLPFSVLVDSGADEGLLENLVLQPTAVYASLGDAINGNAVLELELHAVAQASFVKEEPIDYIVDAYSTRWPISAEEKKERLVCRGEEYALECEARESVSLDAEGTEILHCRADLLSYTIRDRTASASVAATLLLRDSDGVYASVQKMMSCEAEVSDEGCEITEVRILSAAASRIGNEIQLVSALRFCCRKEESEEVTYLASLMLDEENAYDLSQVPALRAVRKRGRSLWELSKAYRSSPEAIRELNERFPMGGDLLLIPQV